MKHYSFFPWPMHLRFALPRLLGYILPNLTLRCVRKSGEVQVENLSVSLFWTGNHPPQKILYSVPFKGQGYFCFKRAHEIR